MHPLVFIVFLPLLAAIVAGLFGRWIGKTAAKVVTTGALFIGAPRICIELNTLLERSRFQRTNGTDTGIHSRSSTKVELLSRPAW